MKKGTPMVEVSSNLFSMKPSVRKKLERVYRAWRKKGLFLMYSADFETAWYQMSDEERMALYQAAVKKSRRRKKRKTGKKVVRKGAVRTAKIIRAKRFDMPKMPDFDRPQVNVERRILIERPVVVGKLDRHVALPERSSNRMVKLLR